MLRLGCARAPGTPSGVRPGPPARIRRDSVPLPVITKPAIRIFTPVPTCARVEILMRRPMSLVETTARVAGKLVAVPSGLVATHVEIPASAVVALLTRRVALVAPAIAPPFTYH